MLYISNFVLDLLNIIENIMKKAIVPHLPLLAITLTLAVAGIEVFQTGENNIPGMRLAEVIFVISLATLFILGTVISISRAKSIAKGLPVDDELSRMAIRAAAAASFFVSLVLWLTVLILGVHTEIETRFLIGFGILGVCLVFLIILAVNSFSHFNQKA